MGWCNLSYKGTRLCSKQHFMKICRASELPSPAHLPACGIAAVVTLLQQAYL